MLQFLFIHLLSLERHKEILQTLRSIYQLDRSLLQNSFGQYFFTVGALWHMDPIMLLSF